jgi:hypothetical protein
LEAFHDRQIQARETACDIWTHGSFERGAGVLVARITPAFKRRFFFRQADSNGKRPHSKLDAMATSC